MSKYTKQDIIRMVEEEDVEFIRLQFTDTFGTLKNIAITSSQLLKALDNQCMFDASYIEGFVRMEESEMYLCPDLDTFVTFPWRPQQGKVARVICDIYRPDGTPFEGDGRGQKGRPAGAGRPGDRRCLPGRGEGRSPHPRRAISWRLGPVDTMVMGTPMRRSKNST